MGEVAFSQGNAGEGYKNNPSPDSVGSSLYTREPYIIRADFIVFRGMSWAPSPAARGEVRTNDIDIDL